METPRHPKGPPDAAQVEAHVKTFVETCSRRGIKVTPQRTEIYREVLGTDEHPDAETVHQRIRQRMPNVSLDTIYRTLYRLEEEGLVSRVHALSGRVRFDADMGSHHHFVCTECGRIEDFRSEDIDALSPPAAARELGEVTSCRMEVRGVCAQCLSKREEEESEAS